MGVPQGHSLGSLPRCQQGPPIAPYTQVALDLDACQKEAASAVANDERAQNMVKLLTNLTEQQPVVIDELPVGGAVLFTHKTLHASLPNFSNAARWTLDIRYSVLGKQDHNYHHDECACTLTTACVPATVRAIDYSLCGCTRLIICVQACLQVDHTF
eukprot:COSAG02_NODE_30450_length_551_cov_0.537611_1_plen_156_part_01